MWPFSEMSLSAASLVGTIANWMLLASLIGGVISTFVIVKTADVKEEHWAVERQIADEKIAELQVQGDESRKATAEANARVAEANLALAKLTTPRSLSPVDRSRLVEVLKEFAKTPFDFFITPDPEPVTLMDQLAELLTDAGWEWKSAGGMVVFQRTGKPNAGMMTGTGVAIQIDHSKLGDWEKAVLALGNGLAAAGIETRAEQLLDGIVDANAVHIRIGKKP
jgi:hypothetical protein